MQIDGLSAALGGFQNAVNRAGQAAQDIASSSSRETGTQDLVKPLVELKVAERDAEANARVIETENKIIGSIIDIKA
ncbi:MAG: flagellar biosynthesis protein FlgE [Gammaproteobacteria bacterium]|nr:flagellar biosynthesis protein FlgE [Gammaproteobacteria bacterium]